MVPFDNTACIYHACGAKKYISKYKVVSTRLNENITVNFINNQI